MNGFESDIQEYIGGDKHVAALSSGTASIHLALELLGFLKVMKYYAKVLHFQHLQTQ